MRQKGLRYFGIFLLGFVFSMTHHISASGFYTFSLNDITGHKQPLSDYKGQVLLLVNVASRCGFSSQYEGLQHLYDTYKDKGFLVIGIPANNFGGQEPGSNEDIKSFCETKFGHIALHKPRNLMILALIRSWRSELQIIKFGGLWNEIWSLFVFLIK